MSHFLGRFRRANYLTATQLGKLTGIGAVISRWEKFYLNPFPTTQELEALAAVVEVKVDKINRDATTIGCDDETKTDSIVWCLLSGVTLSPH